MPAKEKSTALTSYFEGKKVPPGSYLGSKPRHDEFEAAAKKILQKNLKCNTLHRKSKSQNSIFEMLKLSKLLPNSGKLPTTNCMEGNKVPA